MILNFEVNKSHKKKLYIQLYEGIKNVILNGNFEPDEKLPSVRHLINRFSINSSTVLKAYELLNKDGFIYKVPGSGTYLKDFNKDNSVFEKKLISDSSRNNLEFNGISNIIDFASSYPNSELFPIKEFQKSINKAFAKYGTNALKHHDIQGYSCLRRLISREFKNSSSEASYKNIHITSGNQQSLNLIKNILIKPTSTLILSQPTHSETINVFKSYCRVESIDLCSDGFNMDDFRDLLSKVSIDFVYIMTNFQNPTNIKWSQEKKIELLSLANIYDFIIIEKDSLSSFSYDHSSVTSLKSLDKDNKVIYINDYLKTLMPGIPIGYMVLPPKFSSRFIDGKFSLDISTSGLFQRALTELLSDPDFLDFHIEKNKEIFKKRLNLLYKEIKNIADFEIKYHTIGGIYLWVRIPNFINTKDFYLKLKERGVYIIPGDTFYSDKNTSTITLKQIRLSIASVKEKDIINGVKVIKEVLTSFKNNKYSYSNFMPII